MYIDRRLSRVHKHNNDILNEFCITCFAATPSKKKFKFKLDDALHQLQGHNRNTRCSMPALDFHGIKLPSNLNKPKLSLPAVASSIKQHISRSLPTRRASLVTAGIFSMKQTNGDLKRKKLEDLDTMHEHEEEESENEDSMVSSQATFDSEEISRQVSLSGSVESERTQQEGNDSDSTEDEQTKLAVIKEKAKRRCSDSKLDGAKLDYKNINDIVSYKTSSGKTITKPFKLRTSKPIDSPSCDIKNVCGLKMLDIENGQVDRDKVGKYVTNDTVPENNNTVSRDAQNTEQYCNGHANKAASNANPSDIPIVIIHSENEL